MKDAQLGIRISTAKKKELDAHALKNGLTASSLTLALIDEELRRPESLINMYFTITKRFEGVDEKLKVLAKVADGNFNTINENVLLTMRNHVKTLDAILEYSHINEKDHKIINENLALDGTLLKSYGAMLRSIVDYLAKLDEKSVTKDELSKILVRVLAEQKKG